MKNRYNLSVPFIVVDNVGKKSRIFAYNHPQEDQTDDFTFESDKDNNKAPSYEKF